MKKSASYTNRFSKAKLTQTLLVTHLKELFPTWSVEPEYRFHQVRKWRFDVGMVGLMFAFEIEGGHFSAGAHVRGKHFESDMEKYNTAAAHGWKVFRFTHKQVERGEAREFIKEHLA